MNARLNREAQRLAIRFLHQLAAVLEMGTVEVHLEGADTPRPLVLIGEVRRTQEENGTIVRHMGTGRPMSLREFLTLNVPMAMKNGGTYSDLWRTLGRNTQAIVSGWDSEPLDVAELEPAVLASWLKNLAAKKSEES